MSSHITRIDVFPDYDKDGSMNLNLPFSYGCPDLDLWGYSDFEMLIIDIRNRLIEDKVEEKKEDE